MPGPYNTRNSPTDNEGREVTEVTEITNTDPTTEGETSEVTNTVQEQLTQIMDESRVVSTELAAGDQVLTVAGTEHDPKLDHPNGGTELIQKISEAFSREYPERADTYNSRADDYRRPEMSSDRRPEMSSDRRPEMSYHGRPEMASYDEARNTTSYRGFSSSDFDARPAARAASTSYCRPEENQYGPPLEYRHRSEYQGYHNTNPREHRNRSEFPNSDESYFNSGRREGYQRPRSMENLGYQRFNPRDQYRNGPPARSCFRRPERFNGSQAWTEYKTHFEMCAVANKWTEEDKPVQLAASLDGSALQLLTNLSDEERADYHCLTLALKNRFESPHMQSLYRA